MDHDDLGEERGTIISFGLCAATIMHFSVILIAGAAPVDGFCFIEMRTDGRRVYKVECKALARDGRRFEFDFKPQPKPPVIKHF
jgi:hypothetical protein